MSILQFGHKNPLDVIVDKFKWDYGLVAVFMTWALGPGWEDQKAKEYVWRWNELRGREGYECFKDTGDPEKHFLYMAVCFREKIAREQYALRKGAKFAKPCPCGSHKNFEKCCGDLLEYYVPGEGRYNPEARKPGLLGRVMKLAKKPRPWRRGGLGWYKKGKQHE
jgi:hypothetical protein